MNVIKFAVDTSFVPAVTHTFFSFFEAGCSCDGGRADRPSSPRGAFFVNTSARSPNERILYEQEKKEAGRRKKGHVKTRKVESSPRRREWNFSYSDSAR